MAPKKESPKSPAPKVSTGKTAAGKPAKTPPPAAKAVKPVKKTANAEPEAKGKGKSAPAVKASSKAEGKTNPVAAKGSAKAGPGKKKSKSAKETSGEKAVVAKKRPLTGAKSIPSAREAARSKGTESSTKAAPIAKAEAVSKESPSEKTAPDAKEKKDPPSERPEKPKVAANARSMQVMDRKAALDAKKAERTAQLQAAAEARAAKQAEIKAANEARTAKMAEERAAKQAEIKAANEARAAKQAEAKAAPKSPKPITKDAKSEKAVPRNARAAAPAAAQAFDIGLSIRLDKNWDKVISAALDSAAKAVAQQLEGMLKIDAAVDVKQRRTLENDRRRLVRVVERAVGGALTRLLEPQHLQVGKLALNADGTRASVPATALEATAFNMAKVISQYKDLVALIAQPNSSLQQFGLKKPEIALAFGDSLEGDYFLSGTFKLGIDYANPGDSTIAQDFHLFAKRGKQLGPQMKIGFSHDLAGKQYSGQVSADFPVAKAEG